MVALVFGGGCAGPRTSSDPAHGPTFNGTVQSIDLADRRLTVAPLKVSPAVVFLWNHDSKFWVNGVRIEPRQLQAGDVVRIHYFPDAEPKTVQHLYLQTHRTIH